GVRWMRKRRTGVVGGHQRWLRHVRDVENEEAVMPVADIKPVAVTQRMVAPRRGPAIPGIGFATGLPLAGNPPASDLDRFCWVRKVEDHNNVADIALSRRRDVGVTAVEVETMNATAFRPPLRDQPRCRWLRHVIDIDAAADVPGLILAEALLVNDHD